MVDFSHYSQTTFSNSLTGVLALRYDMKPFHKKKNQNNIICLEGYYHSRIKGKSTLQLCIQISVPG